MHPQSIFSLREMVKVASIISCAEEDLDPKGLIGLGGHPSMKGVCKLLCRDYMFQGQMTDLFTEDFNLDARINMTTLRLSLKSRIGMMDGV